MSPHWELSSDLLLVHTRAAELEKLLCKMVPVGGNDTGIYSSIISGGTRSFLPRTSVLHTLGHTCVMWPGFEIWGKEAIIKMTECGGMTRAEKSCSYYVAEF